MTTTEDTPTTLTEAVAAVQSEIPALERKNVGNIRSEKANYSYRYADLAEVTQAILPLLGRNGLAWICQPRYDDGAYVLHYTLKHVSGESIEGTWPLPDPTRADPKQVGSYITYARRYCLCAVTGLAPGDDDDDAAAAHRQAEHEQGQRRRSPTARTRSSNARPLTDPVTVTVTERPAEDGPLSAGTRKHLMALFGEAGLDSHKESDRALRHRACSKVIGRDISTKPLTEGEAQKVAGVLKKQDNKPGWLASVVYERTDSNEDRTAEYREAMAEEEK
jgi:hypothetical protein